MGYYERAVRPFSGFVEAQSKCIFRLHSPVHDALRAANRCHVKAIEFLRRTSRLPALLPSAYFGPTYNRSSILSLSSVSEACWLVLSRRTTLLNKPLYMGRLCELWFDFVRAQAARCCPSSFLENWISGFENWDIAWNWYLVDSDKGEKSSFSVLNIIAFWFCCVIEYWHTSWR